MSSLLGSYTCSLRNATNSYTRFWATHQAAAARCLSRTSCQTSLLCSPVLSVTKLTGLLVEFFSKRLSQLRCPPRCRRASCATGHVPQPYWHDVLDRSGSAGSFSLRGLIATHARARPQSPARDMPSLLLACGRASDPAEGHYRRLAAAGRAIPTKQRSFR